MLDRLFPRQFDNRFDGHRAALWLFGLFVALRLVMSVNSILNTATVAAGPDAIPLDSFGPAGARTVLELFALMALAQLTLLLIGLVALIRYRAMIPSLYLLLLTAQIARHFIVEAHTVAGAASAPVPQYLAFAFLALLALGLALSLVPAPSQEK